MKRFRCKVCGVEFDVQDDQYPACPACGATDSDLEEIK